MVDKMADSYLEKISLAPFIYPPRHGEILIGLPPLSGCVCDIIQNRVSLTQIQLILLPPSAVYDENLRMTGGGGEEDIRIQRWLLRNGKIYVPDVFCQKVPYGNRHEHWVIAPAQRVVLASKEHVAATKTKPTILEDVDVSAHMPSLFQGL